MSGQEKGIFSAFGHTDTDPHRKEAEVALIRLRKAIDELHRTRLLNEMALRGTDRGCPFAPNEMWQRLEMFRDPTMNQRFQHEYLGLMQIIYGRPPTPEEVHMGVPAGAGLADIPLAGVSADVAGRAWGLHGVVQYLAGLEHMARGEIGETTSQASRVARTAVVVGATALVGLGAWWGYHRVQRWREDRKLVGEEPEELLEEPDELVGLKEELTALAGAGEEEAE